MAETTEQLLVCRDLHKRFGERTPRVVLVAQQVQVLVDRVAERARDLVLLARRLEDPVEKVLVALQGLLLALLALGATLRATAMPSGCGGWRRSPFTPACSTRR